MMINTVTVWFEIVQYDDKREITISNLVETTWLSRHKLKPAEELPWNKLCANLIGP